VPISREQNFIMVNPKIHVGWSTLEAKIQSAATPTNPLEDEDFQKAIAYVPVLLTTIAEEVKKLPTSRKKNVLLKKIDRIRDYECSPQKTVAVVGGTGAGKSDTFCSLTGDPKVAKVSADGSAVTQVVQEFKQREVGVNAKYCILCTYSSKEEIRMRMETLLDDYRRPDLEDITSSDADYQAYRKNSRAAQDVFEAAFRWQPDFDLSLVAYGDKGATRDSRITRDEALEQLYTWVDRMPLASGGKDNIVVQSYNDGDEFQSAVLECQSNGRWPFIKSMHVLIDAEILKSGLTFADCPGLGDSNFVRTKAAWRYLGKCNEIWIVANIARANDVDILEEVVDHFFQVQQDVGHITMPTINIICTFSASVSENLESESMIDRDDLKRAKQKLADAEKMNDNEKCQFAKYKLQTLRMLARNENVSRKLQCNDIVKRIPSKVRVFCIDNQLYQEQGPDCEISGIPELKRYAMSLTSQSRFITHNTILTCELPELVNDYASYLKLLQTPFSEMSTDISISAMDLRLIKDDISSWAAASNKFLGAITKHLSNKRGAIMDGAKKLLKEWEALHPGSVAAFFRKEGEHKPKGSKKLICWNSELCSCILKFIRLDLKQLDKRVETQWNEVLEAIANRFEIWEDRYPQQNTPGPAVRLLRSRRDMVGIRIQAARDSFMEELGKIKQKATSGISGTYICDIMEPVYQAGCAVKGRSTHVISLW
jgi:hypothetical protein